MYICICVYMHVSIQQCGCCYLISDSVLVSSYPILICWASSCLWKLQRKNEEGRHSEKIYFQFQLYFICVFARQLCSEEMSSRTIWEPSFLPNQALKHVSRLWWLISRNSVWSYLVVSLMLLGSVYWLASNKYNLHAKSRGIGKTGVLPYQQLDGRKSFSV